MRVCSDLLHAFFSLQKVLKKNLTKEVPELAIELLKKCRKQGYGYQALSLLMDRFAGDTIPSGLPCSGSYIGDFNPAGVCRTLHGFYI